MNNLTNYTSNEALQKFKNLVGIRFQLYNSLFVSLPFHRIERTGILLSLFLLHCEDAFQKNMSPSEIIDSFLNQYTSYKTEQERLDILFRFIQYAERQVVLFDALEDTAFTEVNDVNGPGTLKHLQSEVQQLGKEEQLSKMLHEFMVRIVLTAHPTQFYPGEVLGIIHDLSKALQQDNAGLVNMYLQQLGKTPFFKKIKPTPYDEAMSLIWYMEHIFYPATGEIMMTIKNQVPDLFYEKHPVIRMGFWPGGDRDGNPFVTPQITLQVAQALKKAIVRRYYFDVRELKRRLTFKGVEDKVAQLETLLYEEIYSNGQSQTLSKEIFLQKLREIKTIIIQEHNGLFLHLVDDLISKVEIFGLFFASLDIRQVSTVHEELIDEIVTHTALLPKNYKELSEEEKIKALYHVKHLNNTDFLENNVYKDALEVVAVVQTIQEQNGIEGCHRYIISHATSALNVMEVYALFLLGGWNKESLPIDIVPLFESVEDLQNASSVMEALYKNEIYRKHLAQRNHQQTIMLGFSDGTKDGGYLTANFGIYKAKEQLTAVSKKYGIDVLFFDGRGGPPARGGGKTHRFYASMGSNIANKEIQLTIQGQTVSSNFGTPQSAKFNIEQLIHAGLYNSIIEPHASTLKQEEESLLMALSEKSFEAYSVLKNHPYFLEYLAMVSPLNFYAETNIGSRPSKRKQSGQLSLDDLRAIPFVGAWSQLKQNVPGFYGVGTALNSLQQQGKWQALQEMYRKNLFFKTLIDNCEMAMKKSYFPLTAYLANHPKYGELWRMIYEEYNLTVKLILQLAEHTELMENYPVDQLSIQMRERIVLPLATIQQFALTKLREFQEQLVEPNTKPTYEKLVIRCSFGLINAGRNSA